MVDEFDIKGDEFEYAIGKDCRMECRGEGKCKGVGLSSRCVRCKRKCKSRTLQESKAGDKAIIDAIKAPIGEGEGGNELNIGLVISIAVVALIIIGTILFFVLRKK